MDHGQYSSQHAGALRQWAGLFNVGLQLTKPGIIFGNLTSVLGAIFLSPTATWRPLCRCSPPSLVPRW